MSRNHENTSLFGPVGAATVSLVLAVAITGIVLLGLFSAPVRLPVVDILAAAAQRGSQATVRDFPGGLVVSGIGGSVRQVSASTLIDSPRR